MPLASNSEADMWTSWAAADRIPATGDSVRKSVAIRGDVGPLTCYQIPGEIRGLVANMSSCLPPGRRKE